MKTSVSSISAEELKKEFGVVAQVGESVKAYDETCVDKEDCSRTPNSRKHEATNLSTPTPSSFPLIEEALNNIYAGDIKDDAPALRGEYQKLDFPNSALLVSFFDKHIAEGPTTLHPWQVEVSEQLAEAKATGQHPHKFCLCAANGSGKDAYVLAPFAIWFALCKIRSLTIITSSSGVQLTAQTENLIRSLAEKVNMFFGENIFRIRQRYIKCLLSGSEIRFFATDEAGKAEGYHPLEPTSEMCIIVNEGKSVDQDIHNALRRCTGYNYWIEVSTPGEPMGFFYNAFTTWPHTKRVSAYDCPHIPLSEIEADKIELGEHSPLFRSMRLAEFTSIGGMSIITKELITSLLKIEHFPVLGKHWPVRVGIDIAAGGDENSIYAGKGNQKVLDVNFREFDTTLTADKIDDILSNQLHLPKTHEYIYIDDGHVGHSVTDMLRRKGWVNINRTLNQWAAVRKKQYGNLGAEMWEQTKRIIEERLYDVRQLSETCQEQLYSRQYKQQNTLGRIFLESKRDAKANGRPSPDRADAFILHLRGLTIDDFLEAMSKDSTTDKSARPSIKLTTNDALEDYVTNKAYDENYGQQAQKHKHCRGSLQQAMKGGKGKSTPDFNYGYN